MTGPASKSGPQLLQARQLSKSKMRGKQGGHVSRQGVRVKWQGGLMNRQELWASTKGGDGNHVPAGMQHCRHISDLTTCKSRMAETRKVKHDQRQAHVELSFPLA